MSLKLVQIFTIASAFLSTVAAGAATTGSITLNGNISAATAITVTGNPGYNTLDLTNTATDLAIADIHEINNTTNGYTVTMASANSGSLKNGALGSVTYTAKYNGAAVTLSSTPVVITTATSSNAVVNALKALKVSFAGQPGTSLMVGSYADTLTFTITAS